MEYDDSRFIVDESCKRTDQYKNIHSVIICNMFPVYKLINYRTSTTYTMADTLMIFQVGQMCKHEKFPSPNTKVKLLC